MGSTFTNIHIRKNENVKLSDIEKLLCGEFKKMGFSIAADAETADETVVLCEADGSSWITVCSQGFENKLFWELAKALKTDVMRIECVDSDFIEMWLFNIDGTNAQVVIGEPYYGERKNSYSEWEGKVSDLEKFIEVTNGDYVFAEDALTHLDELMGLPMVQSAMFGDHPPENGEGVTVKLLGFSVAEQSTDEPPKLCYFSRGGIPVPDKPCYGAFMVSNNGGASKGLGIIFYGDYIENDDITFTDCLLHIGGKNIPIELEKKKRDDGSFVLSWRGENFELPAAPDKKLTNEKRMQLKAERMISISYTPHGDFRKFLDIKICFAPLQNWHDGQCHAYIWKGYGSKRKFFEMYNEDMREARPDCGYYPEDPAGLFREEDFDLD